MEENNNDALALKTSPHNLIALAIDKGTNIDQLEKLMDLQERWEAQQAKKAFLGAMSIFQSECSVLNKSKTVGFETKAGRTSYKYTPLGDIIFQIKEVMKQSGLSYRWESKEEADNIEVTCIVSHLDGHSERTTMIGKLDATGSKNIIQQRGSTTSYLRRYTLTSALGIATADEDVDGQQPEQKKGLPELTPDSEKWEGATKSLAEESTTMEQIKKRYKLTKSNEELLWKNANNLK